MLKFASALTLGSLLLTACGSATVPLTNGAANPALRPNTQLRAKWISKKTSAYVPGELVVQMKSGFQTQQLQAFSASSGMRLSKRLNIDGSELHLVKVQNPQQTQQAMQSLQRNPSIQSVSLNPRYTVLQSYPPLSRQNTGVAPANTDISAPRRLNDALYPLQWALPKVGIPTAWNYARGSADLLVAVVDSGIDYNHPDLAGQIVNGIDFMPEMPSGPNGEGSPDTTDMDPNDELGHGTHVAGIIAAHAENQMGVAGIAPNVKILNVKVLNADGWGSSFAIAQGITFAADKGARIINLSLGGPDISKPIELAVKYAQKKGALVIAAAGNSFTHTGYPAAFPGVFAVGATDDNDRLADFSNHDARINVMAPGVDILSTTPMNLTNSMQAGGVDSQYSAMSGTSMACPIVTGQAALILSARPDMTAFQVKQLIEQTAKPVGDARIFGHGRIQIAESLKQLMATPPANPVPADPAAPPVAAQSIARR